jgi:hypothetical protein
MAKLGIWRPYYGSVYSFLFDSTALSLNAFLDREIAHAESIEHPTLQLNNCWFLLSYPEETAVIKRRQHVFNLVAGKYDLFLDNLDVGLKAVSGALEPPRESLDASSNYRQSINNDLSQGKTDITIGSK